MSLGEVISDAVKYPFSDITKFAIVGILSLLASISSVMTPLVGNNSILLIIGVVISFIFGLIISGYGVDVIRNAIQRSSEIPAIDPVVNIVDGIKVLVISIVYYIIPIIIAVALGVFTGVVSAWLNAVQAGINLTTILVVIIFIIFSVLEVVALARFADTGELGAALSIGAVFEDAKKVGFISIILFAIVTLILAFILLIVVGILSIIPIIGTIIGLIILGGFLVLFYYRGIGLLYANA